MKWALDKDLLREWMNCPLDGCTPRHRSLCEISVYRSPLGLPWWLLVKKAPVNAGDMGLIPGPEDPLEKEMAIHSSILAWKVPWTEEPARL